MHTEPLREGLVRRALNDLVLAEVFLFQATIESVQIIGDGLNDIGGAMSTKSTPQPRRPALSALLQRTAGNALEPYAARLEILRQLRKSDCSGQREGAIPPEL
jgi:hypothetical protein